MNHPSLCRYLPTCTVHLDVALQPLQYFQVFARFYRATLCDSAVCAMAWCSSLCVCLSVCPVP